MPRRWLGWSIVLAFSIGGAVSMARQPPDASTKRSAISPAGIWTPLLAADGHPDLQGVWLNNSATPLERPKALEGRPSLTDQEVSALRRPSVPMTMTVVAIAALVAIAVIRRVQFAPPSARAQL